MAIKFTQAEESAHTNEHTVQVQMINLLAKAIIEDKDKDEIMKILDQLITFSQVHFMSEQLIMRQHSYDGFDEHEIEHAELIDHLQEAKEKSLFDENHLKSNSFDRLRSKLLNHIATHDQRLSAFLSSQN